jgi:hypothetical protein
LVPLRSIGVASALGFASSALGFAVAMLVVLVEFRRGHALTAWLAVAIGLVIGKGLDGGATWATDSAEEAAAFTARSRQIGLGAVLALLPPCCSIPTSV